MNLNFKGKTFKFPVAEDKPRAFTTSFDTITKQMSASGLCYEVFKNFIKQNNGKIHPYPLYEPNEKYKSIHQVLKMVQYKKLFATPNCFTAVDQNVFSVTHPIKIVNWCFMVPVVGKIQSYEYILAPFRTDTKITLVLVTFLTGGTFWMISGFKDFSTGLLNGLCGYMALCFCSNLDRFHRATSRWFQILVRVAGFIFSNYYNTLLASFLATTLFGKQINTLHELFETGLKVMVRFNDSESLKEFGIPDYFRERLLVKSGNIVAEHRDQLNSSYAYVVSSDRWFFHEMQQEKMKVHRLRYSEVCYGQYLLTFPLWYDSMFLEPLNYFLINSEATGLINHWSKKTSRDFQRITKMNVSYIEPEAMPMDFVFFTYAWLCILIGSAVSFGFFSIEGIYFYYWMNGLW